MTKPVPQPGWYPDPSGAGGQRYFDGAKWTAYAPPPPPQPSIVINNNNALNTSPAVLVASGPNHALHLILTLLTCGMWLPVWLIFTVVAHGRRVRPTGQSSKTPLVIGGVLGGMFLLGLVGQYPIASVPLAALAGLGYLGYRAYERAVERRTEQAKIAARADTQHRATMSGDPSGLYGQYPPPPMPGEQA
jgi:hypothetical protein